MGAVRRRKSTLGALVARFYDPTDGPRADRRPRRARLLARVAARPGRDRAAGHGPVQRDRARQHRLRHRRRRARRSRRAAHAAAAHEFIRRAAGRLRHRARPAGRRRCRAASASAIGIARTLLRDPPVLVLDEPTTGARRGDSEREVLDGPPTALMRGRTTILITHSARLARTADRIVELDGGRSAPAAGARRPIPRCRSERLLDRDAMARCSSARSGPARGSATLAVGRVVYKPGDTVAVHYRARSTAARHDAVATCIAGVDLAARARMPRYRALRGARRRALARRRASPTTTRPARSSPGCRSTRGCRRSPRTPAELARRLGTRRCPASPCWSATSRARAPCCAAAGTCSRPTARRARSTRR